MREAVSADSEIAIESPSATNKKATTQEFWFQLANVQRKVRKETHSIFFYNKNWYYKDIR